jgi:hypothetical protein
VNEVYANPFNVCDRCKRRVSWGGTVTGVFRNLPCGHAAGFHSVCPSWSPVDGCNCERFGQRQHGEPTFTEEAT